MGSEVLRSCQALNVPRVCTTSWFKNYGTEYKIGIFACASTENEMPVLKKIVNIIIKDEAFLLTATVNTMYFDDHLNGFRIEEVEDEFAVICVAHLIYYWPYDR